MPSPLPRAEMPNRALPSSALFAREDVEQSIPARFEQQARMYPEKIAIADEACALSYRDLNRLANRIGRSLLALRGAGSEPVALHVGGGVPVVAAMLGVLKAGKFYVALDGSQPMARMAAVLAETRPAVLIADSARMQQAEALRASSGDSGEPCPVLNLDALDPDLSDENLALTIAAEDLAYVLFTSGSTGTPKGVMQDHRYVLHLTMVYTNSGQISPADRLSLLSSPSFAGAVRDIYCALLNGASLATFDVKRQGLACLAAWLRQERITVCFAVATVFRHFGRMLSPEDRFPAMRLIELGSETVFAEDVQLYRRHFPGACRLIVNLGGSELSPICQFPIDADTEIAGSTVPAGYAADDVELLLWDPEGRPASAGTDGEIVVRSRYLCRGYWRRPELTDAAFLPDPEGGDKRLYRTGDLGRLLPDGCLLHLGRCDFQVKIRGHRVETAEVEAFFTRTGLIADAAVTAWRDSTGEQNLAAWLVPVRPQAPPSADELRALVTAALPEYMVPARIVLMESLPVTTSGKVDRRALPDPPLATEQPADQMAPRSGVEQRLHDIWSDVLGRTNIGIEQNFFDLGGHSLLAMQVVARIAASFRVALRPNCLFEAPTLAQLADVVQRARRVEAGEVICELPESVPLSAALAFDTRQGAVTAGQEEFWIASTLGLPTTGAQITRVLSVVGTVPEPERWRSAWTRLVARHAALRTAFCSGPDDTIRFRVHDAAELAPRVQFSLDRCDSRSAARERIAAHAYAPFVLSEAPLARAGLLQVTQDGDETLFWFAAHHAVVDGLSARIIQEELHVLLSEGTLPLAPNGVALASHTEQVYLQSELAARDRSFWRDALDALAAQAGAEAFNECAPDRPRPAVPSGDSVSALVERLDANVVAALTRLIRDQRVGLHALLLTLLAAEVRRRDGRSNPIIGSGISLRPPGADRAVGHFVNLVPLGLTTRSAASLAQQMRAVQARLSEALEHGRYPSGLLYRDFRQRHPHARPHSRTSLFDISLTANPSRTSGAAGAGFSLTPSRLPGERAYPAAGLDLAFSHEPIEDHAGGLELTLVWNPDVYTRQTAQAWLTSFAAWARWLAEDIARAAAPLPPLLPEEAARLSQWEHGPTRDRPARRFHELFECLADSHPQRAAVVSDAGVQSFAELEQRANRIAWALLDHGVASEEPVAVLTDCSPDLPATVLGIWKAGAAYLPLALEQPAQRLTHIVRDAAARILIVLDGHVVPQSLTNVVETIVRPRDCDASATLARAERPEIAGTPQSLAYIIYTSGTTGTPKGVLIQHNGLLNVAYATWESIGPTLNRLEDRVALVSTPGFDASLWELGLALLHGLALVPAPRALRDDPWALKKHYTRLGVTIAFHAPSYLRVSQQTPFEGMRVLLTGSEAVTHDDARHHVDQLALWNAYGPTETCIIVSLERIPPDPDTSRPLSVGRPIPNASMSIRRDSGELVPPGVLGEVWLGGTGLARGYLNNPELTAQKFVETPTGRFYRTGDRARWTDDGRLELAGRTDHQIKLQGQRVELGEIEQALRSHPAVEECVTLVAPAANDTKVLLAFVRLRPAAERPTQQAWRNHLGDRLPPYMLPASVTVVTAMPLTFAGKLDRDALLRAPRERSDDAAKTPPSGELEARIAALWGELLGAAVAREDNFFALGGNSLLAVTVAHRLSGELARQIPARMLFMAPTLAGFAQRIATLPGAAPDTDDHAQTAAPHRTDLATEGQREFWIAEAAGLDTRTFTMPLLRIVKGETPSIERWNSAWSDLVARHAALRSYFHEDAQGRLRSAVVHTLRPLLEHATRPDMLSAKLLIRQRQSEPIAMGVPPLWRAGLVELADSGEQLFWLALHHALGDGQSLGIIAQELSALLRGESLSEPSCEFAHSAAQEQAYLSGPACAADGGYWHELLARPPAAAFDEPPLDFPRSLTAKTGNHRFETHLDVKTTQQLRALAQQHDASVHALMLTLLALEARRRTGRSDIVVGTTASTRETAAEAQVVGYYVNMLPLPCQLPRAATFGVALRETQRALAQALQHARYPFARMYRDFWREHPQQRHPARYPLFDLAVTENPESRQEPASVRLVPVAADGGTATSVVYELTDASPGQDMVLTHERLADGGLLLQWHVNAAVYKRETASRWFEALRGWAVWLAEEPKRCCETWPALLPHEAALLASYEQGPTVARPPLRLHELFERVLDAPGTNQAARPAIVTHTITTTYEALEQEANATAHSLLLRGAAAGTVVGVLTERSPNLPAAVLGIWKAGATYLPLSADLPPERLAFMARDAGMGRLIALDGLVIPSALDRLSPSVIRPEQVAADFRRSHAHRPPSSVGGPDAPAYIIYTSGSTGWPKGTLIGHDAYLNCVLGTGETLGLTRDDRSLMFASPSFDVSLLDMGVPLAFGAAVCPVPYEILSSPSRFRSFLSELNVSVADITPTYLRLLDGATLPSIRVLVTGGEAPFPADVRRYAARHQYWNAYGPTENSITSTLGRLSPHDQGIPACGRPLPNTSAQICDQEGRPVAPGVIGELWLGGAGLALGYVGRSDLTAAAFVETARGRRYRSGDLGRWRDSGELEILGRIDDQVKLSGVRIELGEIEHVLGSHPAVAQAVAMLGGDGGSKNRSRSLWAFARLLPEHEAETEEGLRDYLSDRLPTYMIPSAVIAVASIPVTVAGKVDRAALEVLLAGRAPRSEACLPPDGLEADIARLWSELLGRAPIHRDDNFFALGGHSLLAIAVAHALERTLAHPVPARELFAAPTLRGFAQRVAQLGPSVVAATAPEICSDRATEGQREFWIAEQAGLDTRSFNISLTLLVRGPVPPDSQWRLAWAQLVSRHGALRTGFYADRDGLLRCSELPRLGAELEITTQPDVVTALAEVRKRQTEAFSMERPPLWRAGLVHVNGQDHPMFWLALHHAVGDGVSVAVLTDELACLLRGQSLPALASTFGHCAGLEEQYLAGPSCRQDALYWQRILRELGDGSPDTPQPFDEWPLDFPRPMARTQGDAKGCHVFRIHLDRATAAGLRAFAQKHGASLHALMLTIMAHEVRRRTGRLEFALGTAASTRDSIRQAQLVGYYVTLLPVPCRAQPEASVELALQAMQRSLAAGLQHARYPFACIVRDFRRDHDAPQHPARHPLFDLAVTEEPGIGAGESADDHTLRFCSITELTGEAAQYELRPHAPGHDMVLAHACQADGSLSLHWYVNAALYEKETAEAWIDSLAGWARLLSDAERVAGSLWPSLLPHEQAQLDSWERGPILPHPAASFPAQVERWASIQSERPALITEHGAQSYAQLNARANALAHALRAHGVAPQTRVGVLTDRSLALPELVLAIWKAGGCYLPLLSDLPADRLAFMARDAGIQVLVALDGHEIPAALAHACGNVFRPDTVSDAFFASHGHAIETEGDGVGGSEHAYIMYTSGSTGVPKGVLLRHQGLNNLGVGVSATLGLRSDDRVLLLASPAFDAWISELVMAWAVGAALVPVLRHEMNDTAGMRDKLARLGVSVAGMTPSYLRLFEQADFPSLRMLITAGEPPQPADVQHYAARLRYINGYGPTENTVAVSYGRVSARAQRLTVGKPLANTSVHIRSRDGESLPPAAVGLVWLGGMGLASGYLNRPELTAASFVETAAGRLYCTGDLGRWTRAGELQILGRRDEQVKLHGQRIELGEIEHCLAAHPSVQQAVAAVERGPDGAQILWAFVCLQRGAIEPSQAQWHEHLGRILPAYMLPSAVIGVAAIPVSTTGKVDRPALLRTRHGPQHSSLRDAIDRTPPRNDIEQRIARVWAEHLGCRSLARDDNFFECGGNSLQAIAVVNRLRRTFQCTIKDLYEHPRLADFARVCRPQPEHLHMTIRSAARHWQSYQSRLASYEQERDAALSAAHRSYELRNQSYRCREVAGCRDYGRVLLTGAAGYLGSYVLRELLSDPERRVSVLLRGHDDAAARARLGATLCHYFGPEQGAQLRDTPRLTVLAGDLRRDDLGLSPAAHERLADGLHAIFHAAANVKHFGHYWEFHADNVAATGRLLQLAARHSSSPADFHLVSTLSTCGAAPETGFRLFTEYDPVPEALDENYYVRSKQEAERLVVAARQYLANACIHRVGNLVFAADGGPLQVDIKSNAFFRQLAALIALGVVPDDAHLWLCHVDIVARGLVLLASSTGLTHETHHLEHARRDTLAAFLSTAGAVRACGFDAFLQRLDAAVDEPELDAALAQTLENFRLYDGLSPQVRARRLEIVSDRSQMQLAQLGLSWPAAAGPAQAAMLREAAGLFSRPSSANTDCTDSAAQ